jgi:glycerol-3-phosphate acyltransferase PlsY
VTWLVIAAVTGYLLGSLPFGYLVARAYGVDIFKVGSGSPGATNVKRSVGARAGNTVFALDALKGAAASAWTLLRFRGESGEVDLVLAGVIGLIAALIGHSYSCFTGFRGGKGVATAAGGLLVLMPLVCLTAFAVWAGVFFAFRYVSLASILGAVALPLAAWGWGQPVLLLGLSLVIALFVIVRHRANISRLLAGTENRFGRKPPAP